MRPDKARQLQKEAAHAAGEVDGEDELEDDEPAWGAPVELCVRDKYAVIYCESHDGPGIDIVKVEDTNLSAKGEEEFTGTLYHPASSTLSAKCLDVKWYPARKRKSTQSNSTKFKCWSVLTYFDKWTKNRRLFKKTKDDIMSTIALHSLNIFADDDTDNAYEEYKGTHDDDDDDDDNAD